jgi:AraC-like DNA-binding protein
MKPRVSVSGARAAYIGPGLALAPHTNAAATVALALGAPFTLALRGAAPEARAAALIPPNTPHHLVPAGGMVWLYLDALSDDHRALRDRDLAAPTDPAALADVDTLCAALGVPQRPPPDPRVAAAVRALDARPRDLPTIADAARVAGLSPSRLQALFTPAVGVPFRRYRLWRRLASALRAASEGATLTDAAYASGFASSAHLSATFRGQFGLSPSVFLATGVTFDWGAAPA